MPRSSACGAPLLSLALWGACYVAIGLAAAAFALARLVEPKRGQEP